MGMKDFDVVVTYSSGLGDRKETTFPIKANSHVVARSLARKRFEGMRRYSNSVIMNVKATLVAEVQEFVLGQRYTSNTGVAFTIVAEFAGLKKRPQFVVERDDGDQKIFDLSQLRALLKPKETVEYLSVYPQGNVYRSDYSPVKSSSYGLDQLIQVKVTKVNGKIVKKELV
jgi:aspartyl/asparaginyl-tRNA synthetase